MKSILTLTGVLFVIAAIAALFYGGYLSILYLWQIFAELEFVTRVVLLSGMSAALVSAFIIAGAIKTAGVSASKSQLAQQKLNLYKSLVDIYKPCFLTAESTSCQLNGLRELETELQLLSATQVLELHGKLSRNLQNRESRKQADSLFRQLIKAIRRDLGQASGYEESKLGALFVHSENQDQTHAEHEARV